jgi:TPR repeat protein
MRLHYTPVISPIQFLQGSVLSFGKNGDAHETALVDRIAGCSSVGCRCGLRRHDRHHHPEQHSVSGIKAAATWLTKAADGGDVLAQAQLGNAYMTGNGVAQDDTKAIPLLTKAATAGNGNAQANLGYIYSTGRGVPKDKYQFMVWTVKGGEQGTPVALMNIAEAYLRGEAVPQDNDKAAYYMTAAAQRATGAQRSRFLTAVNNLSRQMSLADFKHEAERAQRWSPGPGSLSDVLDDAARRQKQGSQG